jgi:hypothetical protein
MAQPKLVFGRFEGRCFLRQIWFPEGTALELPDPLIQSEIGRTGENLEAVYLDAKPLCIHHSEGLPPSWH